MIYGLYQSAGGMMTQMENHQVIAENLAASSVPGFRRNIASFETYLPAGSVEHTAPVKSRDNYFDIQPWKQTAPNIKTFTDFTYGNLQRDGHPTHFAISGGGFFVVESPGGDQTAYTRNGSFIISETGELVTQEGWKLQGEGGPIRIPNPSKSFSLSERGELAQSGAILGKLKLTDFANPNQELEWMGGRYFVQKDGATEVKPSDQSTILQGYLEGSNVNPVREMVSMIQASRMYEANQKMLQTQDDSLENTIRVATR